MKCMICEKEVIPTKEYTLYEARWQVNGAVLGDDIELNGHKECLQNVEELVVFPNRLRFIAYTSTRKEK